MLFFYIYTATNMKNTQVFGCVPSNKQYCSGTNATLIYIENIHQVYGKTVSCERTATLSFFSTRYLKSVPQR